ncbi:hypothetical protein [Rhodopirellula sp. MGV]|uniref:hypothetical protein n=1 Tax=Rhodopirellula sp. MGV TaxID=2023130 RepID=UPI000B95E9EB|nr:hypothetical protein [Rhodopirellula sp. MGV]PNY38706.1 hypothetical protein C2E31_01975 [Rhodopirellula baltica]
MSKNRVTLLAIAVIALASLLVNPSVVPQTGSPSQVDAVAARYHLRNRTRNFYRSSGKRSRTAMVSRSRRS